MFRKIGMLAALAIAASLGSGMACAAPDPGGGIYDAPAALQAAAYAAPEADGGSGVGDVIVGVVFLAAIGFVAYTIYKKKQAKKAARAASAGSTTIRPPNSG